MFDSFSASRDSNSHASRSGGAAPLAAADPNSPPARRIQVEHEIGPDGQRQVVLQDLSYGEGLGWYVQKSIRLDPQQVDALLGALCCARQDPRRSPHGDRDAQNDASPGTAPCTAPCTDGRAPREGQILSIEDLLKN